MSCCWLHMSCLWFTEICTFTTLLAILQTKHDDNHLQSWPTKNNCAHIWIHKTLRSEHYLPSMGYSNAKSEISIYRHDFGHQTKICQIKTKITKHQETYKCVYWVIKPLSWHFLSVSSGNGAEGNSRLISPPFPLHNVLTHQRGKNPNQDENQ